MHTDQSSAAWAERKGEVSAIAHVDLYNPFVLPPPVSILSTWARSTARMSEREKSSVGCCKNEKETAPAYGQ
eukprot:scaffold13954_cov56-Isochrysis_galbana.AAC.1